MAGLVLAMAFIFSCNSAPDSSGDMQGEKAGCRAFEIFVAQSYVA